MSTEIQDPADRVCHALVDKLIEGGFLDKAGGPCQYANYWGDQKLNRIIINKMAEPGLDYSIRLARQADDLRYATGFIKPITGEQLNGLLDEAVASVRKPSHVEALASRSRESSSIEL